MEKHILPQNPLPLDLLTPRQTPEPKSDTPVQNTPLLLPASLDASDPSLFGLIHRTITACEHLNTKDRRVLRAVFSNIPSQLDNDNALVRRMITLDPPQLQVLAQVFEAGLIAARNFGGRPLSSAPTPTTERDRFAVGRKRPSSHCGGGGGAGSLSRKRPKLNLEPTEPVPPTNPQLHPRAPLVPASPTLSPEGPTPDPAPNTSTPFPLVSPTLSRMDPPPTPVELLFRALDIFGGVPNLRPLARGRGRSGSRLGQRADACLARQNNTCPITGRTADLFQLETAYLIPHSIAAVETADDLPYWRMLRLCLGPVLSDHIFNLVAGSNSFRSTNGIAMDPTLHGSLFDRGIFWLIPHLPDAFQQGITPSYDVEFKWRADRRFLSTITTNIPQDPDDQLTNSSIAYNHLDTARTLSSGDRFRLFTPDTERYPLPHPLLLSLHARLWEMIAASGLSDTVKSRFTIASSIAPRALSRQTRGSRLRRDSGHSPCAGSGSGTPAVHGSVVAGGLVDAGLHNSATGGTGGVSLPAMVTQQLNQTIETVDTAYLDFKLR